MLCAGRVICRKDTGCDIVGIRPPRDDAQRAPALLRQRSRVPASPLLARQCNMKADIAWYLAEMPDEPWGYGFDTAVGDGEV